MIFINAVIQAAAEYGAATGNAAGSVPDGARTYGEVLDLLTANPIALIVGGVSLLLVIGLFKTRSYRS